MLKVIHDQRQTPSDVKDDATEQYLAATPQKRRHFASLRLLK